MLEAISEKCEGLMLKLLDSIQIPETTTEVKNEDDDRDVELEEQDELEEDIAEEPADDEEKPYTTEVAKKGRRKALLATYEPDKRVESWVSQLLVRTGMRSYDLLVAQGQTRLWRHG